MGGVCKYEGSIGLVPLQHGNIWIINGVFKLTDDVDLGKMRQFMEEIAYLKDATECISRIASAPRSINWVGSARKWVVGTSDAADWNATVATEEVVSKNSDQQLRINFDSLTSPTSQLRKNEVIQE